MGIFFPDDFREVNAGPAVTRFFHRIADRTGGVFQEQKGFEIRFLAGQFFKGKALKIGLINSVPDLGSNVGGGGFEGLGYWEMMFAGKKLYKNTLSLKEYERVLSEIKRLLKGNSRSIDIQ